MRKEERGFMEHLQVDLLLVISTLLDQKKVLYLLNVNYM